MDMHCIELKGGKFAIALKLHGLRKGKGKGRGEGNGKGRGRERATEKREQERPRRKLIHLYNRPE